MIEEFLSLHPLLPTVAGLLALALSAVAADLIVKRVLLRLLKHFARRGVVRWGEMLVDANVFGRLAQVVPALIVYSGIGFVEGLSESVDAVARSVALAYMVLMLVLSLTALLGAANRIYDTYPVAKLRPIKGFIQLLQLVVYVLGGILMIAVLIDRSPLILLSGFGAMTAVLLLVFRDTILGLVASIQLTSQDMVRVGDWVEMPQAGADGDVIEVALHTIKVQNWDKTVTTIPTHKFISESFKNWRGMSESGGRRIKRALRLDQSSIRFLSEEEIESLKKFAVLEGYIDEKRRELDDYHASLGTLSQIEINRRRLTNVGTFRAYVLGYLKTHPAIHQGMTLLVRQLAPGPEGLPIEIYCFTNTTAWNVYENIQSDIFDYIIAILPEFDLRPFQNPTGGDFTVLARRPQ